MKAKYLGIVFAAGMLFFVHAAHADQAAVPGDAENAPAAAAPEDNVALARKAYFKGMMMASHERYDSAVKDFEEALKLNPKHYDTYIMLGKVYTRINRAKDSEDILLTATTVQPKNPEAYDALMTLYLFLERPKDAVAISETAVKAGVDPNALPDIGWSYYQAGMDDKAEESYNRQLKADPAAYGPLRNLGILAYTRGDCQKALDYYLEAEKSDPKNKTLPYLKALAYVKVGTTQDVNRELDLMKLRDPKYSRKIPKYNAQYFPRIKKVDDLNRYIYMLREDWQENNEKSMQKVREGLATGEGNAEQPSGDNSAATPPVQDKPAPAGPVSGAGASE